MALASWAIDDDRDRLVISWDLNRTAQEVWGHLTDADFMHEWIGVPLDVTGEPGLVTRIDHGHNYVCEQRILVIDPDHHHLHTTWQCPDEPQTELSIQLIATTQDTDFGSTSLTLTHTGLGPMTADYLKGWIVHLLFFEASLVEHPIPFNQFWTIYATLNTFETNLKSNQAP